MTFTKWKFNNKHIIHERLALIFCHETSEKYLLTEYNTQHNIYMYGMDSIYS